GSRTSGAGRAPRAPGPRPRTRRSRRERGVGDRGRPADADGGLRKVSVAAWPPSRTGVGPAATPRAAREARAAAARHGRRTGGGAPAAQPGPPDHPHTRQAAESLSGMRPAARGGRPPPALLLPWLG